MTTVLARIISERIAAGGPMRIDRYMELCLGHPELGYYQTRDPFGTAGDFVTAPEVSQMFGELIGAWTAVVWSDLGRPSPFILAELGPGRGTLMRDALRVAARAPGFVGAVRPWLVETSPVLRQIQARTLRGSLCADGPFWTERVEMVPPGPMILLANEFFDALPVRQFQRVDQLWRERQVELREGALVLGQAAPRPEPWLSARFPDLPDGAFVETCPAGEAIAARIGTRLVRGGGAALVIDYGAWDGHGDTLQALRRHMPVDILDAPGSADLTTHVRFRTLAEAAAPARAWGPVGQGVFLERLGIDLRAATLSEGKDAAAIEAIAAAHRRLTHPDEMGNLFQAMALTSPAATAPPGLEA